MASGAAERGFKLRQLDRCRANVRWLVRDMLFLSPPDLVGECCGIEALSNKKMAQGGGGFDKYRENINIERVQT